MASDRVLSIPELLELILLNLPFKAAIQAKAISRSWNYTIENSIQLKRALFLAPAGETPIRPLPAAQGIEKYQTWDTVLQKKPIAILPQFIKDSTYRPACKSFLGPWSYEYTTGAKSARYDLNWYAENLDLHNGLRGLPPAYRSMYLTQPPITACKVDMPALSADVTVYDKDGITLGLVADILAQVLRQFDQCKDKERGDWRELIARFPIGVRFRMPLWT